MGMRGRSIGLALIAALAVSGAAAGSASAKAVSLYLEANGEVLPAGAPLTATNASVLMATMLHGNIECTTNELAGTVSENGKKLDRASITSLSTTDLPSSTLCSTGFEEGPGTFAAVDLPWTMRFTTKGTTELKSAANVMVGKKSEGVMFELWWGLQKQACKYTSAAVKAGTFPINEPSMLEKPLVVSYTGTFSLFPDSGKECGKQGGNGATLTASFALTSNGFPVYAYLK
jgi:hypothetical protein